MNKLVTHDQIFLPATQEHKSAFWSPKEAQANNFRSKTAWLNDGRTLAEDADYAIVIRKVGKVRGIGWHPIVEDLGNDSYLVAVDFFLVYHESQTVLKQKRAPGKTPNKTRKKISLYIPSNFDPTIVSDKNRDYACWLLSLMHWKWINWQGDENGWINLKREYLDKVIPWRTFNALRDELIRLCVIDCDFLAIDGQKCYSYRVHPKYWTTHRRILSTDSILCRNLEKLDRTKTRLPVHDHLEEQFASLEFDLPRALQIIPTLAPTDLKKTIAEYHKQLIAQCQRIVDQDFSITPDDYGRVHTPITCLPRELRSCLRVDDEQLVNVDLANSQPLILALCAIPFFSNRQSKYRLLKKQFVGKYADLRQLEESVGKLLSSLSSNLVSTNSEPMTTIHQYTPITIPDKSQHEAGNELVTSQERDIWDKYPDLEHYQRLCENGQFYDLLMQRGEDRGAFKEKLYQEVFFGKNCYSSSLKDRFAELFPSIAQMLQELKRNNYRFSAQLMQHYESSLFIHCISRRIMNERPDVVFFTIHDSILTKRENVAVVKQVITEEFGKLGIKPTLKEEDYGRSVTACDEHCEWAIAC